MKIKKLEWRSIISEEFFNKGFRLWVGEFVLPGFPLRSHFRYEVGNMIEYEEPKVEDQDKFYVLDSVNLKKHGPFPRYEEAMEKAQRLFEEEIMKTFFEDEDN